MTEVIRGDRKVEWVDIGEGWNGDYDPDDPDDTALLRFDVLELTNIHGLFSDSPVTVSYTHLPLPTNPYE